MTEVGGVTVAAHYGSPAAELAVCVRAVGLVDRSDLAKIVVRGRPQELAELVHERTGSSLAPGGVVVASGAWWCAASPMRLVILADAADRSALVRALQRATVHANGTGLTDRSDAWSAIALLGRNTVSVLSALGACADPRLAPPFGPAEVRNARVELLLQSDRRALMLVDPRAADQVWRAIGDAGREFGLSCVGVEAATRFALLDRGIEQVRGTIT